MHGIKVPYADLSASYFYNSNLEGSDLSHANISFSNLEYTNFKGCDMRNSSHGLIPLAEMKQCKEAWLSPTGKYIVWDFYSPSCPLFQIQKIESIQNSQQIIGKPIQFSPQENYIIFESLEKKYAIHSLLNNKCLKYQFESSKLFAFSPSEKYLAFYSFGTLCIRDLQTDLICSSTSFQLRLFYINWSPIEDFVLVQSARDWIIWDIRNSIKIQQFDFGNNYHDYPKDFAFSWHGKYMVIYNSKYSEDTFLIWNSQTKAVINIQTIEKEQFEIKFSSTHEKIFVKSGRHLSIWNAETSEELARSKDYYDTLSAAVMSPIGDYIFIYGDDGLGLYDCENNVAEKSINYYDFESCQYVATKKRPQIVFKGLLLQIDYNFSHNLDDFLRKNSNAANSACFSCDDKYFATSNYNRVINIWDMRKKEIISALKTDEPPASLFFSPSSKFLVVKSSISEPIEATVWNWKKKAIIWKHCFVTPIRVISFSISENFWAVGSGSIIYIWDKNSIMHIIDSNWDITSTAILDGSFTENENYFVYGNDRGEINFFLLRSKSIEKTISLGISRMMIFSNSSQYVAIYDRNSNLKIWNIIDDPFIAYEVNEIKNLQSIIISTDGNYVILQRKGDCSFEILDTLKGCTIFRSKNCIHKIKWISWSWSGNFIIATSKGFIGIWDFKALMSKRSIDLAFNDKASLNEIECLDWARSSNNFNIRNCDFSDAKMSDNNWLSIKEINN
ncbi:unnamed protein product [Blepharisma stoltei]|uniref:Uncharacterized protein n=1 Tax=Blepharisma stoltei TaxID=1481888 RepID=A0AAU9KBA3_9CILI|nr:unnamed protein product [Blepharisma stoltei]